MRQHLIVTGRLGKDAELGYTDSGKAFTKFSLATSTSWKGADGQRHRETTWWDVTVWGEQADAVADWCRKGDIVEVTGTIAGEREGRSALFRLMPRSGRNGASLHWLPQPRRLPAYA